MKDIVEQFNQIATDYDKQRPQLVPGFYDYYGASLAVLNYSGNAPRVLDLGCGTGLLSAFMIEKYPEAELTLIDIADGMVDIARERFKSRPFSTTFIVGDYTTYSFGKEFDIIVSGLSISGYTFLGWSTSKTDNGNLLAANYVYGQKAAEQKNTTLYAIWDKNTELNVSWDSSDSVIDVTKSIDKSLTSYSIPFYWNSSTKGTSYSIKQSYNGTVKDVKTVKQETDSSSLVEDTFKIDTSSLIYGPNIITFDF